jgi:predicted nucleic acid-binding protein
LEISGQLLIRNARIRLFVDTAGWLACANAADIAHAEACNAPDAALERGIILVTTDYIFDETRALIRKRMGLDAAEK